MKPACKTFDKSWRTACAVELASRATTHTMIKQHYLGLNIMLFEILDKMTFIPILAIELASKDEQESWLLRRAGYNIISDTRILLCQIQVSNGRCSSDPHSWNDRTYQTAHMYIVEHWHELRSGAVIDVEFILGETTVRKTSERFL